MALFLNTLACMSQMCSQIIDAETLQVTLSTGKLEAVRKEGVKERKKDDEAEKRETGCLTLCDLLKKKYRLNDREVEVRRTERAHIVLLKWDTNPHSLSSRNEPIDPLKLSTLGSY